MNYEEKYKQALENFKKIKSANSDNKKLVNFIECEYPELRESEDERIRYSLMSFLNSLSETEVPSQEEFKKWWMWLEKQGEKTIPKNINDAALQYVDTCAVDGRVTHDNINEPYWNNHSMMAAYKAGWLEKQGEENIIDLKEYAKGILKGAAIHLMVWIDENLADGNMCLSNMECKDLEDAMVNAKWDKIYNYIKKKVEKQGEQRSWSKEDEEMLDSIIDCIDGTGLLDFDQIDWLKSIKHNHWKPSEEQMQALIKRTQGLHTNSETRKVLESLIFDLQEKL